MNVLNVMGIPIMVLKVAPLLAPKRHHPHFTLFWSTAPKRQRGYAAMFRRPCLRGRGVFVRMPLGAVAAVVCARSCLGMAGASLNQVKTLVPSTPGGCSATVGRAGAGPCGMMWEFMFSVGGPCVSPSPCARPPGPVRVPQPLCAFPSPSEFDCLLYHRHQHHQNAFPCASSCSMPHNTNQHSVCVSAACRVPEPPHP
jgi:hypothetical protein